MAQADAYRDAYTPQANAAAKKYGVPENIFSAVVAAGSSWNPWDVSESGAIGLSQLTPDKAEALGVNAWNPKENLEGGAASLAQYKEQTGNWRDAIAEYTGQGTDYADTVIRDASAQSNTTTDATGMPISDPSGVAQADTTAGGGEFGLFAWVKANARLVGVLLLAIVLVALGLWVIIGSKQSKGAP